MKKRSSIENQRIAREAVRVLTAALLLMLFSATAIANHQRPFGMTSPGLAAPTLQPTTSPTFQRQVAGIQASQSKALFRIPASPSILGQTTVDSYTVSLYHFDSLVGNLVPDATGNYTASLVGSGTVTPAGLYGGALYLDGNSSYLRILNLPAMSQGTIEAFVDFSQTCIGVGGFFSLFSAGGDYHSNQRSMSLRNNGYLDFQILTGNKWVIASSGINPCRYLIGGYPAPASYWPYETWRFHHVAATWGPRGTEIWVDGVLHGLGNDWIIPASTPALYVPPPPGTPTPVTTYTPVFYGGLYWCNPQLQGGYLYSTATPPNPVYPLCPTPVVVTPPAYPSGDYTGPLPAFTQFLVGCDADVDPLLICFRGRMDEVRISNIQRTFSPTVIPTSTPTPTQTPDVIAGAYKVDAHTKYLYHLDTEQLPQKKVYEEVAAAYNAQVWGGVSVVPGGRFGQGLSFDGVAGSYVNLGNLNNPPGNAGVIEAWVKLNSATNPEIITSGAYDPNNTHPSNVRLGVDTTYGNTVQFGVTDPGGNWRWANSGVAPAAFVGAWHHVAGTFGARGLEIWVDGKLCGTNPSYAGFNGQYGGAYLVGCDAQHRCMKGMVDEVRFSDIQRSFTFSPAPFAPSRFNLSTAFQMFLPMIFSSPPSLCGSSSAPPVNIQSIP